VIAGDLAQPVSAQGVQTGVADVPDGHTVLFDDRDGEDARHPSLLGEGLGSLQDLPVGERDRLAHTLLGRARPALETGANDVVRDPRRDFTGGVPADAVHDEEDPVLRVDVEAVLVVLARAAAIARPGSPEPDCGRHVRGQPADRERRPDQTSAAARTSSHASSGSRSQ
jgi:hypothetical protein